MVVAWPRSAIAALFASIAFSIELAAASVDGRAAIVVAAIGVAPVVPRLVVEAERRLVGATVVVDALEERNVHVLAELGPEKVGEPHGRLEERGAQDKVAVISVAAEQRRQRDELPRNIQLVRGHCPTTG